MGRRGPAPTPTNVLALHGSWRAKKNPSEPHPEAGRPSCPKWMTPDARRIWKEVVKILGGMKVLTKAERFILIRYCDEFQRWISLSKYIAEHGEIYPIRNKLGEVVKFETWPQVVIAQKLSVSLRRAEQELGLTPAARTRIAIESGVRSGDKKPNRWSGMASA